MLKYSQLKTKGELKMSLHELLKTIQDMKLEVHIYDKLYSEETKEIAVLKGSGCDISVMFLSGKIKGIDWNKTSVFYIGHLTSRSRTLRINCEIK